MSPCTDWIDNAGLNIALRQEAGEEDIFRSVYSAMTRTLPQLNDQVEVKKGKWLLVGGRGGGEDTKLCKSLVGRLLHLAGLCKILEWMNALSAWLKLTIIYV